MITQKSVQEILDTVKIEDVVQDFVSLRRRGTNLIGLCPFHHEKTPSFNVSPARNIFKCFGCGKGGNAVQFLMELERFTFPEALKYIAKKYGIQIEEIESSREAAEERRVADSLYIINQYALEFFQNQLVNTDRGRSVGLSYFRERGFREETIQKFGLGYAPEKRDQFLTTATAAGYDQQMLFNLGLCSPPDASRNLPPRDFFRDRVIFPIHGMSGKVTGVKNSSFRTSGCTAQRCNAVVKAAVDDVRSSGEVESIQYEFVGLRRDGSRVDLEVFGRHFEYEGRPATIGIVIDISQRKLAEQAQSRALAEAERLAQVRRDFLANMSHEIRTPLSAILGLAQVGMREDSGRQSSHTFGRILDSGQLLLGVINDILDFSKIEAGKLDVEALPFDPCEAIDRAVGFVAPQAQAKGLEFVVEEAADLPARCAGDKLRLSQILVNLLSNAVKFTERGMVRLRVTREAGWLRFEVIDSGIGIPADQLARLFRPFEQGDTTTTRRFGGTGLGLTISNRLAGLMASELTARSRVGEGATFTLRMPLRDAAEPARVHGSIGIVLSGIEDDLAGEVAGALTDRGVQVTLRTPAAAFELQADLVVIDGSACDDAMCAQVRQAIAGGRRVAVVRRGDAQVPLDDELRAGLTHIDYPLRARHLIAAARPGAGSPGTTMSSGARLRGVRVLAAEDNAINREVLSEIMALEGAQLTLAEDGEQAVARLQHDGAQAFDVLLTDIQMPGIDGYETARRALALAPDLPVMGLTAHAMRDERDRCLAAGMVEHVAKPIDIDALVCAVLRHLRRPDGVAAGAASAPRVTQSDAREAEVAEPAIDWAALEKRFAARPAFVRRLGQMLVQGQSGTPAQLRELAASVDRAQIAFVAHTLKGVAGNLMAKPTEALARETEAAARADSPEAERLALQLAEALQSMIDAVHLRFPDGGTPVALTIGG